MLQQPSSKLTYYSTFYKNNTTHYRSKSLNFDQGIHKY